MTGLLNPTTLFIEISAGWFKALCGEEGLELMIERDAAGRLTAPTKAKIGTALSGLLKRRAWHPRVRAYCAIGARGVTLRQLTLPAAARDQFQRLLQMQVESAFPLPPDELAWGWQKAGNPRENGASRLDIVVMAIRKEILQDYSALLSDSGITPVFTLAGLARSGLVSQPPMNYATFEYHAGQAEFVVFENGVPTSVKVIQSSANSDPGKGTVLAEALKTAQVSRVFLSGSGDGSQADIQRALQALGSAVDLHRLSVPAGPGRSAAVLGLKRIVEERSAALLSFEAPQLTSRALSKQNQPWKLAVAAAVLLAGLLILPYAQAILLKPWLAKSLNNMKADIGRLEVIDRERDFLQFLKQNQPPYLDALYLFSKFAPSGTKVDSVNMDRRGQISLRASMRNSEQVAEFRAKLIGSGFFGSVVVEEQTPTPDRQKVNVRLSAQWKPANELQALAIGPTAEEIEKAKSNKAASSSAPAPMLGGIPSSLPSGATPASPPAGVVRVNTFPGAPAAITTQPPPPMPAPEPAVKGGR